MIAAIRVLTLRTEREEWGTLGEKDGDTSFLPRLSRIGVRGT